MQKRYSDVLIIGAGPAGSVAACLLRKQGFSVNIIEKQRFPRFVIGESLLPQCMNILQEAGVLGALKQAGFQHKNGAAFHYAGHYSEFAFKYKCSDGPASTFQVKRAEFDTILADCATQAGAAIYFGEQVTAVSLEYLNCHVSSCDEQSQAREYHAKFVLDASGYGRVLARLLDLDMPAQSAPRAALFTHVRDHIVDDDYDREKILIAVHPQHKDVWYWLIPFADGSSSLGIVADQDYINHRFADPSQRLSQIKVSQLFKQIIDQEPLLQRLLGNADYSCSNLSNSASSPHGIQRIDAFAKNIKQLFGDGYALLGNAGAFLDPVFSSGVSLAINAASLAATSLARMLRGEAVDWQRDYSDVLNSGVEVFRQYVDAWYAGSLQDIIFHPAPEQMVKQQVSAVLAGYVWDGNNPFVAKAQKRIALFSHLCQQQAAGLSDVAD